MLGVLRDLPTLISDCLVIGTRRQRRMDATLVPEPNNKGIFVPLHYTVVGTMGLFAAR